MQRVQFIRHAAAAADAFTGLVGEVTVVLDGGGLRVHDGAIAGGYSIKTHAENLTLFQGLDGDLTAFAALDGTAGFLVKTGANAYTRRTLLGTSAEITVTYGDGVSGNPTLSLPAALTFTGKSVQGGTFTGLTITDPTFTNLSHTDLETDAANANKVVAYLASTGAPTTIPYATSQTADAIVRANSAGQIDVSFFPDSLVGSVKYQGTWNANTNSPAIPAAAASNEGHYYIISTAGTTAIDGINDWQINDWIISNGVTWEKIDNTEPTASETVAGIVELATQDETDTGTDDARAVTPLKLATYKKPYDIPFVAGFDSTWTAEACMVQTYCKLTLPRAIAIDGAFADIETAPTGTALIMDILVNGSTIYSSKPQFAAGSTTLSAGTLSTTTATAGDVITFAITQVGSTVAGAGVTFTLKGRAA